MHKGFYGYQRGKVETRYTVEYIDDEPSWNLFLKAQRTDNDIEPWETYKKRVYDNISEAMSFFVVKYMHEGTYDIQMVEEISLDGEVILEQHIEPIPIFAYTLREVVNDGLLKQREELLKSHEADELEIGYYKRFIRHYHAEKMFKQWEKGETQ